MSTVARVGQLRAWHDQGCVLQYVVLSLPRLIEWQHARVLITSSDASDDDVGKVLTMRVSDVSEDELICDV